MLELNLPKFNFKIKEIDGKHQIFDENRRKFIALTPEEWVRQNFVAFLVQHKKYPAGLIANEATVMINGMRKRCDTVIYNREGTPEVIVEYKAPEVRITQKVFDQIAMYNFKLNVNLLIVTNGLTHYCCRMDFEKKNYNFLKDIPNCYF